MKPAERLALPMVIKRKPAKGKPIEPVAVGLLIPEARRAGRVVRRVYVTRNLLHVLADVDIVDDWPTILCRFDADEQPAPFREAMQCTVEVLEKIVAQVDAGRAKAAKGELRLEQVEQMERRAGAIIDVMAAKGVARVVTFQEATA
jgi:hypothetical protein